MGDRAAWGDGSGRVEAGGVEAGGAATGDVEAEGRGGVGPGEAARRVGARTDLTPRQARTPAATPSRAHAWAELLRLPALFTVPGDALAGAAATGGRLNRRTLLAIGSSLCLYEAGMALNDWADRAEDAVERPHRPLPSGRVHPTAAFTAACAFTTGGLALAARAGRPALAVAVPLAATVWAYDLAAKHTPAGPPAMALARGLDVLLGAAATAGRIREALPSAAVLGTHTLAVTTVSRQETRGGSHLVPMAALATTAVLSRLLTRPSPSHAAAEPSAESHAHTGRPHLRTATAREDARTHGMPASTATANQNPLPTALTTAYLATTARPYFHATLNPSPPLTQRAVSGGIRAMIPLQATLAARSGAPVTALLTAALAPLARRFARKVTIT
ncbi:SCO3242 family prenyltransferase [Streptomyces blattellae]|uniref:SCO3242 family prenyltransferase n=1 Tax=Streptomyces blattellae TaxID=2569855 RepID=UPI0012B85723|nr:UbiA family prenyltransferase [Streptomyces blattellae]